MKRITVCLLIAFFLVQARGAEPTWLTDLAKAKAQAKAEKKMILLDFTGSDWCPPCKRLKKEVFSAPEFAEFAKDYLVLVEVDFPNSKPQSEELKKANEALAQQYSIEGYPTVIVLSSTGKEIKRLGYDGSSAKKFVAQLEKLRIREVSGKLSE
jgi:thioredoxin-related protein